MSKTNDPNKMLVCHGRKCKFEGKKHPNKHLIQSETNKTKRFCKSCFDEENELKVERAKLEDFICQLHGLPSPRNLPAIIKAQIKSFENKGFTLKNIRLALHYFHVIKDNAVLPSRGIGIVPYIHDEMIEYYKAKLKRQQETAVVNKTVVKVKTNFPKRRNTYQQEKTIDLEALANAINE